MKWWRCSINSFRMLDLGCSMSLSGSVSVSSVWHWVRRYMVFGLLLGVSQRCLMLQWQYPDTVSMFTPQTYKLDVMSRWPTVTVDSPQDAVSSSSLLWSACLTAGYYQNHMLLISTVLLHLHLASDQPTLKLMFAFLCHLCRKGCQKQNLTGWYQCWLQIHFSPGPLHLTDKFFQSCCLSTDSSYLSSHSQATDLDLPASHTSVCTINSSSVR